MEYGKFLLAPFSCAMVDRSELNARQNAVWRAYAAVVMILYIPIGVVLSLIAIVQIALLFVTIVGIPVALVVARSLGTIFNPVNKKCVPQAVADELARRRAQTQVAKHLGA